MIIAVINGAIAVPGLAVFGLAVFFISRKRWR